MSLLSQLRDTFFERRSSWQVTLTVVFLAQAFTAVGFSMVFPFLPLYVEHLGSVTGMSVELMAGLVIAAQAFTMMVVSPLWGAAADRYGRKLMVMRAMFGGSVVLLLMGLVRNGEQLIILRGIQGMITGTVAANNALVAAAVPRERIGFAMGVLQVGQWGGFALGQIVGGVLADAFGFAMPFFITAAALLVSGVLVYFGVQEDFTPADETAERPNLLQQWGHVLRAEGVGMVYTLRFMAGVARFMIVPIAPLFIMSLLPAGSTNIGTFTGSVTAVSYAAATFSGIYLGRLGDRIGHRQILLWSSVAAVVVYIPQIFVDSVWAFWFWQAMAGLAMGGVISAPSALLAHYTDAGEEGATYGLDNAVISASRFVAPLIGSALVLGFGDMRLTFAATAIMFTVIVAGTYFYLPEQRKHTLQRATAAGD
ncbi:MAG: MFS transporter [Chloroflexota bacterium]